MFQPLHMPGRVVFTTIGVGPSWLRVPAAPEAVGDARRFVAMRLDRCERDFVDTSALVTSELVTNAVQHALRHPAPPKNVAPGIWLGVLHRPGFVHLRVRAPFPQPPTPRVAAETDVGGRGLAIVEMLAAAYWVDSGRFDKTVHAVIAEPGTVPTEDEIDGLRWS